MFCRISFNISVSGKAIVWLVVIDESGDPGEGRQARREGEPGSLTHSVLLGARAPVLNKFVVKPESAAIFTI